MDICDPSDPKVDLTKPSDSLDINGWVKFTCIFSVDSQSVFEAACKYVDDHLGCSPKLYLLDDNPTPAELALVSALDSSGERWRSLMKFYKYENLMRLYHSISSRSKPKLAFPPIDLPGARSGEVCMRFKTKPSPFLHINDARTAFWNHYFAERYHGKFFIWIDDAQPNNKENPFVPNLLQDIQCLDIKCDTVVYTSQYFSEMIEMAEDLINKGKAYVDYSSRNAIVLEARNCIESECRNQSLEKNKELWKEMVAGSDIGRDCFLRGKLDMMHPNMSFRDPVYYCCNPDPHHQITGTLYKVYPTPIFAASYVDGRETVTHILQPSHKQATAYPVYCRVRQDMGMHHVAQSHECKPMHMECTPRNPQDLHWFVENGEVDGWDDPRLPTLRGLLRRGMQIEALKQFLLETGLGIDQRKSLWRINCKVISDRTVRAHTAILPNKDVPFVLENGPRKLTYTKFLVSDRLVTVVARSDTIWLEKSESPSISVGDKVPLAFWNVAKVTDVIQNESGIMTGLKGHLTNEPTQTSTPYLWLTPEDRPVKLRLIEFDHLITKKKLKSGEHFLGFLNSSTKKETLALGDSMLRHTKRGDTVLLARRGYFICDVPFVKCSEPVVLISIPDTLLNTLSLWF